MAKSTARANKTEKTRSAARSSKTTAVEVVEDGASADSGVDGATAIVTALVLIAAIVLVDHELGAMGAGIFF